MNKEIITLRNIHKQYSVQHIIIRAPNPNTFKHMYVLYIIYAVYYVYLYHQVELLRPQCIWLTFFEN